MQQISRADSPKGKSEGLQAVLGQSLGHGVSEAPGVWPDGFEDFYLGSYQSLVRLAALILGRSDVAEEVVQDVFIEVARRWAEIQRPESYVRAAVVNRSRTALRRRRRETPTDEVTVDIGYELDNVAPELSAMWGAVGRLSPRRRTAVVLRFYEDLDDAEIADILDCRLSTVRSLVHRALRQLERQLP